jgi:hypothetical protein
MIKMCEACKKNVATQKHHKFHKVKWVKKLYKELIHDERNLQDACEACNVSHAGLGLIHWSEEEFCEALNIQVRSKSGKKRIL